MQHARLCATLDFIEQSIETLARPPRWPRAMRHAAIARACNSLARILEDFSSEELFALEPGVRKLFDYHVPAVGPTELAGLQNGWAGIAVLTWHPNGHVRENAVRHLRLCPDSIKLPLLLQRTSDWVPQVRSAAVAATELEYPVPDTSRVLEQLPLLAKLLGSPRAQQSSFIAGLLDLLRAAEDRLVITILKRLPPTGRLNSYRLLCELGKVSEALVGSMLRDPAATVRSLAATVLARNEGLRHSWGLCQEALASEDPKLRQAGLVALHRDWPAELPQVLQRLQWDPHPAVLATVLFYLRQRGDLDLREQREVLSAGTQLDRLAPALLALGYGKDSRDSDLVGNYLTHPRWTVRLAALTALRQLGPQPYMDRIVDRLGDTNNRVRRRAAQVVRSSGPPQFVDRLIAIARENQGSTLRQVLKVMLDLPTWEAVIALLTVRRGGCPETLALVDSLILSRIVGNFSRPTPADAETIEALLQGQLGETMKQIAAELRRRLTW